MSIINFNDENRIYRQKSLDSYDKSIQLGDIIFELVLDILKPESLHIGLKNKEPGLFIDFYDEKPVSVDLARYNGINVEDKQVAEIPCSRLEKAIQDQSEVRYRENTVDWKVPKERLKDAITSLFSIILDYESQTIQYNIVYDPEHTGGPINRKAKVRIDNMNLLQGFDLPFLQQLPSTYNTNDPHSQTIIKRFLDNPSFEVKQLMVKEPKWTYTCSGILVPNPKNA